jgi:hypothetical protein
MNGDRVLFEHGLLSLPNRLAPVMEHHILFHGCYVCIPETPKHQKKEDGEWRRRVCYLKQQARVLF